MRYWEIASGIRLPVSCEEQELIDKARKQPLDRDTLDERDQQVCHLLVSRGVMDYLRQGDRVFYKPSSIDQIWRSRYAEY